jgi:DNA-binding MurR/RpiR family transcriptional regulator
MENIKLDFSINNPIYLSVSEAAKLAGVQNKTIRRALKQAGELKFRIVKNRYQIDLASLIIFLHKKTKLKNKLYNCGLGQYVNKWQAPKSPSTKINYEYIKKINQTKNRLDS